MSQKIKLAFGTDDKINFTNDHFGSSKYYLLYELDLARGKFNKIDEIENTSIEERIHGDPEKAKSVSEVLKNVSVLVGFAMGSNIVRMKKKYLIIISKEKNIKKAIENLPLQEIRLELEKEGEKEILAIN